MIQASAMNANGQHASIIILYQSGDVDVLIFTNDLMFYQIEAPALADVILVIRDLEDAENRRVVDTVVR